MQYPLLPVLALLRLLARRFLEREELLGPECLVVDERGRLDEVLQVGSAKSSAGGVNDRVSLAALSGRKIGGLGGNGRTS